MLQMESSKPKTPFQGTWKNHSKVFSNEETALLCVAAALEKKAQRPVILDMTNMGAFADYFVILSADNPKHAVAIADEIRSTLKSVFGILPISSDGFVSGTWILLDYGSIFIHIFQEPTRSLYQLEQLWCKAKHVPFTESEVHLLLQESMSNASCSPLQ